MSTFQFEKGKQYLQPVTFGPSVSPRQDQYGKRFDTQRPIHQEMHSIVYESDLDQLEAIVPPGFQVRTPYVIVNYVMLSDVMWLAGKSYGLVNVYLPVRYEGREDRIQGLYNAVMWEGHPDPLITGRDQIAMNKLCGNIQWFEKQGPKIHASISSWDFTFGEMDQYPDEPLEEGDVEEMVSILSNPDDMGLFNYRYIPNPEIPDQPDLEYATFTPTVIRNGISWNPPADYDPEQIKPSTTTFCKGALRWNRASWEQLPTSWRIVNTLQSLALKRYVGSAITISYNPNDFLTTKKLK